MDLQFIFGLLLSAGIGISLGLFGGGGSILTVPLLVYWFRQTPHDAMPMSLVVVGTTSLVGAAMQIRAGRLRLAIGLPFAAAGMLGALAGAQLMYLFTAPQLLLTFAALMIVVSVRMLAKSAPAERPEHAPAPHALWKIATIGLGVGILTGFLGVGGGFLIVPALLYFGGLDIKSAVATSLLVVALNCAAGIAGHWQSSVFDIRLAALVTACALGGVWVGTRLAARMHSARLQQAFAGFVLAVAVLLVVKNLPDVL